MFNRCPDLLTNPTAELTIALMLGVARHVRNGDALVRGEGSVRGTGRLSSIRPSSADSKLSDFPGWRGVYYGMGIEGATVGIIGMGAVGKAVAQRLVGFNPKHILFHDPAENFVGASEHCIDWQSSDVHSSVKGRCEHLPLPEVLQRSDFVVTGCPLTPDTVELINSDSLAQVCVSLFYCCCYCFASTVLNSCVRLRFMLCIFCFCVVYSHISPLPA